MPASKLVALSLKPGKEGAFFARHPWVLAKSLLPAADWPADGDEVDLLTNKGSWIARGIYNGRSHIRVRLYSWTAHESLDEAFWQRRLAAAIAWRRQIGYDHPTGSARLVFSEADGISGLIVDRYCSYLVVQVTALAIQQRLDGVERLAPTVEERIEVVLDRRLRSAVVGKTTRGRGTTMSPTWAIRCAA